MSKDLKIDILSTLVTCIFRIQAKITSFNVVNYPKDKQVIFALYHAHQCALHTCQNKDKLNVLISKSRDGEIITRAAQAMGVQVVRGSQKRGGARASLELLDLLERGENIAITVDGPKGPKRIVKEGIIFIAQKSQVPIVPLLWYSPNKRFLNIKSSWDGLRFPIGPMHTVVVCGDPMYIPKDISREQVKEYCVLLQNKMLDIYNDLKQNYYSYEKK